MTVIQLKRKRGLRLLRGEWRAFRRHYASLRRAGEGRWVSAELSVRMWWAICCTLREIDRRYNA